MRRNYSSGHRRRPPPPPDASLPIQDSPNSINPQETTNFYWGGEGISSECDMTEIQVRATLLLARARHESEERLKNSSPPDSDETMISLAPSPASAYLLEHLDCAPRTTSLKRSVQAVLQRRKERILRASSSSSSSSSNVSS